MSKRKIPSREQLKEILGRATGGRWFHNSYSGIASTADQEEPLAQVFVEEGHGDQSSGRHYADMELMSLARAMAEHIVGKP